MAPNQGDEHLGERARIASEESVSSTAESGQGDGAECLEVAVESSSWQRPGLEDGGMSMKGLHRINVARRQYCEIGRQAPYWACESTESMVTGASVNKALGEVDKRGLPQRLRGGRVLAEWGIYMSIFAPYSDEIASVEVGQAEGFQKRRSLPPVKRIRTSNL